MRQILLDTETTGLNPEEGHRIIEIGCVELVDRQLTSKRFHVYLNPQRKIDAGALEVHGIDNNFLADKPLFRDVAEDFLNFIKESEVIIHNAPFDVGFINFELRLIDPDNQDMGEYCSITDTLVIARKKYPGQRNSLDALCKRFGIDNSHRDLHGALLDAEILADVYLRMTGGQISLLPDENDEQEPSMVNGTAEKLTTRPQLAVVRCSHEEQLAHEKKLAEINQASDGNCLWTQIGPAGG